ncbi:hypothetical protein [Tardiphaga sp. 768_D3_N2_1]|uniref:hypothetical protein n=1 Tax=Tardiphaga sp. 768_D3_N2_1 TaxID=3240783 RepID=UPI003F8BD67F
MSSSDILPYAAPVLFAAMVAITSWLSYRRIMRKYPASKTAPLPAKGLKASPQHK